MDSVHLDDHNQFSSELSSLHDCSSACWLLSAPPFTLLSRVFLNIIICKMQGNTIAGMLI